MNLPALLTVDRFLQPLVGTTLLLGLLLLWQGTYDQSCVALASPALVYIAILYGLLEYRLERKRFAVDYYLDRQSSWRKRLRGDVATGGGQHGHGAAAGGFSGRLRGPLAAD